MQSVEEVREGSVADQTGVHRGLVRRVVSSSTFARAERLSSLLSYVCEQTLNGCSDGLSEQHVGEAVFGRARGYDCSIDGIVRTQASRLRQRLNTYFEGEGISESIKITIKPGGYVPLFEPRVSADNPVVVDVPDITPNHTDAISGTTKPQDRPQWMLYALLGMFITLAGMGLVIARRAHPSLPIATENSPQNISGNLLWQRLFVLTRPTIFVPADSALVVFTGLTKRSTSLGEYVRGDYRAQSRLAPNEQREFSIHVANAPYTSMVDLNMAVGLARVASLRSTHLDIRYARDVRPNDLKSVNVVLSGAVQANPWVQLFEPHMNFVLQYDPQTLVSTFINRRPAANEPAQWQSHIDDPQRRVYGVVAFLPNLSGDGDVLILEGTSVSGTEAAWDYVKEDSKLVPFLTKIQKPDGSLPHFELLLLTNNMGSSAVETLVIAYRLET